MLLLWPIFLVYCFFVFFLLFLDFFVCLFPNKMFDSIFMSHFQMFSSKLGGTSLFLKNAGIYENIIIMVDLTKWLSEYQQKIFTAKQPLLITSNLFHPKFMISVIILIMIYKCSCFER